jgi:hypothetical protein
MQRKQKTFLFIVIALPLFIGFSLYWAGSSPKALYAASCFLVIYPLILLFTLLTPFKNKIIRNAFPIKTLTQPTWLINIFLIQIFTFCLFIGQFYSLGQYEVQAGHLTQKQLPSWFNHLLLQFFSGWNIAIWSFIAVALCIFIKTKEKLKKPNALTNALPFGNSLTARFSKAFASNYIYQTTRIMVCFSMVLIVLQITSLIYPKYQPLFNPLFGIIIAGAIFFLSTLHIMQRMFLRLREYKAPPIILFALFLFLSIIIVFVVALLMGKLGMRTQTILQTWQTLSFFNASELPIVDRLVSIEWWIMLTPLLASMFFMISNKHSIKKTLVAILILPVLTTIFAFTAIGHHRMINLNHITIFVIQMIGFLGLIFLLSNKTSNRILWFGYFTDTPMKKIRVAHPRMLWQLSGCILGLLALNGIQGIYMLFSVGAIGISLIYLLLIARARS